MNDYDDTPEPIANWLSFALLAAGLGVLAGCVWICWRWL